MPIVPSAEQVKEAFTKTTKSIDDKLKAAAEDHVTKGPQQIPHENLPKEEGDRAAREARKEELNK